MMTNITKNKITINSIIEFVHKAMHNSLCVSKGLGGYTIYNDKKEDITFIVSDNHIRVYTDNEGYLVIGNVLTERDRLDLKALELDVNEYNEDKALNTFNNFFSDTVDKPTSVDDLNDDDE